MPVKIAGALPTLEDALVALMHSALTGVGAVAIAGAIGDGQEFPRVGGVLVPTALLELGSPTEPGRRMRGITGPRDDQMLIDFAVLCVAESSRSCNALVGMVIDSLRGEVPVAGAGVIECFGAAARAPSLAAFHPTRYAKTVGFGLSIGAIVVS